jgi:hypothetical protein
MRSAGRGRHAQPMVLRRAIGVTFIGMKNCSGRKMIVLSCPIGTDALTQISHPAFFFSVHDSPVMEAPGHHKEHLESSQ